MKITIIILISICCIAAIILFLKNVSIERRLTDSIVTLPGSHFSITDKTISEEDLEGFPQLLKTYMHKRGMMGKPLYTNAVLEFNGEFKMLKCKILWINKKVNQVENEINNWLMENQNIEIKAVSMQPNWAFAIFYEEK